MPSRLIRMQHAGHLHFITFSCDGRLPYLGTVERRTCFVEMLEAARLRHQFLIFGYVVMPEHVHLLMNEPPESDTPAVIQGLKVSVSRRFPETPFWLARYYDFNVFTEKKRIEKLRYMHRNPVTRELVANKEDWEWSSFNFYKSRQQGTVQVTLWER